MTIKLIAAVDQGNAIGWSDGRLPWRIPEDMKRFKTLTEGHVVVMGRKTWDSLPPKFKPLPNRKNIMLTQHWQLGMGHPDVDVYDSLQGVLSAYRRGALAHRDLWIIGGASVYDQALDLGCVDQISLTLVHADSGADVKLKHDLSAWKLWVLRSGHKWEVLEHEQAPAAGDIPACTFITLVKT